MFTLRSSAFTHDGPIPRAHTCDGADLSPPLAWSEVPGDTKEFVLVVDDPDAPGGTFVHWVVYGVPGDTTNLPSGFPKEAETARPVRARQGMNDFRRVGYGGPCPPPGAPHRYVFTLYALDVPLDIPPGATKGILLTEMEEHVIEKAELVGKYGR